MHRILPLLLIAAICTSCELKDAKLLNEIDAVRDSLKTQYAPDKRVALFDVDLTLQKGKLILSGMSDQPEALNAFLGYLAKTGFEIENDIVSLPDSSVGNWKYGVINNSVANLRSEPRHSAELATQAVLGTEVKILQILDEWFLVQTPDGYISWIDHGGVQLMGEEEMDTWRTTEKAIVTVNTAQVLSEGRILGDAVLGSILKLNGQDDQNYWVEYPDGRKGELGKNFALSLKEWKEVLKPSGELLEQYALDLLGYPYLWGGTSSKGMDCSGFTKIVYFMNGMVIDRDASQQINAGSVVDPNLTFSGLERGDLVFFGKAATDSTRQKVTHVGLWIGNQEFIHSSMRVRISSIDPSSERYDEMNVNRYLGARRYLGFNSAGIRPF